MDELLKELANLLHLSQDSLVKLGESYPALRNQYIVYSIASDLSMLAIIAIIAAGISIIYANCIASDSKHLIGENCSHAIDRSKIWMKVGVVLLVSSISVYMIAGIAAAVLAPDINLIRDIVANMQGS